MSFDLSAPFVLFDDASSPDRPARLMRAPREIVVARCRAEVSGALDRLRALADTGLTVAGYAAYDAGHALEPRLAREIPERSSAMPLLWFGAFGEVTPCDTEALLSEVERRPLEVDAPAPRIGFTGYSRALQACQTLIEAGDVYQVNLTFPVDIRFSGHPLSLYARLRRTQRMEYGAVVWTGESWLLSASPELFFRTEGAAVTARPMKGTARRRPIHEEDVAAAEALRADPKNRAENLMITDLIRNDLSRIAKPGSVAVEDAFKVERYPTVHQMTTTVTALLKDDVGPVDVLRTLFPCGSITGAPKIRAMQVIDEIEARARGPYTGAIGWISVEKGATFNVAIRTIEIERGGCASMGVGSGIVADSDASSEWSECLEKMAFVTKSGRPFHLIETMAFTPAEAIALLPLHMQRLKASAHHHGFAIDSHAIRNLLQATVGRLKAPARVKLTLAANGAVALACTPMPERPSAPLSVRLAPLPVPADDPRLFHKTSDRRFYDEARRASGTDEVVFVRPDGFVTEGSIASVFLERDGKLLTPPLSEGLLSGVLRESLIESDKALEARLAADDLRGGFLLGNAVRGLFPARLVDTP